MNLHPRENLSLYTLSVPVLYIVNLIFFSRAKLDIGYRFYSVFSL